MKNSMTPILAIIAIVALVVFIGQPGLTGNVTGVSCSEIDDGLPVGLGLPIGLQPSIPGITTLTRERFSQKFVDICDRGMPLYEYYCDGNSVKWRAVNCYCSTDPATKAGYCHDPSIPPELR